MNYKNNFNCKKNIKILNKKITSFDKNVKEATASLLKLQLFAILNQKKKKSKFLIKSF